MTIKNIFLTMLGCLFIAISSTVSNADIYDPLCEGLDPPPWCDREIIVII